MATFDRKDSRGNAVQFQVAGDAPPEVKAAGDGPIAVIVAHGMGQQVPFQTLGDFVEGLRIHAGKPGAGVLAKTEFVVLPDGKRERISWLEATLLLQGRPRVVHFYELYWAPLTEGVATLRDVIQFLVRAGIGRLTPSRIRFSRWLFGDFRMLGVPITTQALLLIALAVVGSLVVLNSAIFAIAAAKASGIVPKSLSPEVIAHLTRTFALLLAVFAAFLLTLALSWPRRMPSAVRFIFRWTSLLLFVAVLAGTIATAAITAAAMTGWRPGMGAPLVSLTAWADGYGVLIWSTLVATSWFVRSYVVQYVGDVAVYVESQSVDRFSLARQAIRDAAMKTARVVYGMKQYRDIAFAGHSLGSVVAYDTLNQLFLEDPSRSQRTRLLMTFGSPLDKTAYLFGAQVADNSARELLAASVQPLIQKAALRPHWVNVYSPWDVIGGKLDFYDAPKGPPPAAKRIHNLRDPDARTLLAAHTEHWRGPFIYETFIAELAKQV